MNLSLKTAEREFKAAELLLEVAGFLYFSLAHYLSCILEVISSLAHRQCQRKVRVALRKAELQRDGFNKTHNEVTGFVLLCFYPHVYNLKPHHRLPVLGLSHQQPVDYNGLTGKWVLQANHVGISWCTKIQYIYIYTRIQVIESTYDSFILVSTTPFRHLGVS